jgi:hypothetical protein
MQSLTVDTKVQWHLSEPEGTLSKPEERLSYIPHRR